MDVKFKEAKVHFKAIALCLLIFACISCHQKKEVKIPVDIIGQDTMVQILTEMHLLESSLGIKIFEEKKIVDTRNLVKSKIYEQFGVSKERFFKSYTYYTQNSAVIDTIFTDIISEISKRQAEQQLKK